MTNSYTLRAGDLVEYAGHGVEPYAYLKDVLKRLSRTTNRHWRSKPHLERRQGKRIRF